MKNEQTTKRNTEIEDAREFAEMCQKLTKEERAAVKNIMIGIQISRPAGSREVVNA